MVAINESENNVSERKTDKIILVPFANLNNFMTGVNINDKEKSCEIYLKNCCVALISAKYYNPDSDVALVTNIDVPDNYKKILIQNKILIISVAFDDFNFGCDYTWSLAFYKLCAINHLVKNYDYSYYAYLDSDVYVQSSFKNIWEECNDSIMLYDINHGLQVEHYRHFLNEITSFAGERRLLTHYGGEFFAASKSNAEIFISRCNEIYRKMIATNFVTTHGDEFIIALAADSLKETVKNAGAYIFRFWTATFRLVSTSYQYNPVVVLHVPNEKERGMIKVYEKYISKGKIPRNKKIYRIFRFKKIDFITKIKIFAKKILNR